MVQIKSKTPFVLLLAILLQPVVLLAAETATDIKVKPLGDGTVKIIGNAAAAAPTTSAGAVPALTGTNIIEKKDSGSTLTPAPGVTFPITFPGPNCGSYPEGSREKQICVCRSSGRRPPVLAATCDQLLRYDQCVQNNAGDRDVVGKCECGVGLRTEGCAEFYNP